MRESLIGDQIGWPGIPKSQDSRVRTGKVSNKFNSFSGFIFVPDHENMCLKFVSVL